MFETLVVSRTIVRPDGRAGLAALLFHLLVFALVLEQRTGPTARVGPSSEAIRIVFTGNPPPPARDPGRVPSTVLHSPPPAPEVVPIPALPAAGPVSASPPLDLARLVPATSGALTAPAAGIARLDAPAGLTDAAEADLPPRLSTPINPAYPPALRAAGVEGETVVEYAVGEDGRVDTSSVRVIQATHPGFIPPVLTALASARFTPAQLAGAPIAVRVRQRIVFRVR